MPVCMVVSVLIKLVSVVFGPPKGAYKLALYRSDVLELALNKDA